MPRAPEPTQVSNDRALEVTALPQRAPAGAIALGVVLDQLVGIELRGVRRTVEQPEHAEPRTHELLDERGAMDGMAAQDQEDGTLGPVDQALEERHELLGRHLAGHDHEPDLAPRADRQH